MQALRFSPALTLTIAGGVAMHFVLGAATFDQLWYVQERGFERAEIARMTGWIGMIAGVLGNLFGGMAGDWWLRRTGSGRAVFLFWLGIALAPLNIAYRMVPGDSPSSGSASSPATSGWARSTAPPSPPFRNWCRRRSAPPWSRSTSSCST